MPENQNIFSNLYIANRCPMSKIKFANLTYKNKKKSRINTEPNPNIAVVGN